MSKMDCPIHGQQGKVAIGVHKRMCHVCYNEMLRTGKSDNATILDERWRIFEQAARLWKEMELPLWPVKGWADGMDTVWDVPGVLEEAARRIREKID